MQKIKNQKTNKEKGTNTQHGYDASLIYTQDTMNFGDTSNMMIMSPSLGLGIINLIVLNYRLYLYCIILEKLNYFCQKLNYTIL